MKRMTAPTERGGYAEGGCHCLTIPRSCSRSSRSCSLQFIHAETAAQVRFRQRTGSTQLGHDDQGRSVGDDHSILVGSHATGTVGVYNILFVSANRWFADQPGVEQKTLSPPARNLLLRHPWPGNVRELQATIDRLVLWTPNASVAAEDVREEVLGTVREEPADLLDRRRADDDGTLVAYWM